MSALLSSTRVKLWNGRLSCHVEFSLCWLSTRLLSYKRCECIHGKLHWKKLSPELSTGWNFLCQKVLSLASPPELIRSRQLQLMIKLFPDVAGRYKFLLQVAIVISPSDRKVILLQFKILSLFDVEAYDSQHYIRIALFAFELSKIWSILASMFSSQKLKSIFVIPSGYCLEVRTGFSRQFFSLFLADL